MKKCVAILLLTALAVFPGPSYAEEGTYVIATDYWPPFRIESNTLEIVGIDRDILDEVSRRMGIHFVWHRRPWARCLSDMESGQSDLLTGIAKTQEGTRYIVYSDVPYYSCSPRFYRLKGYLKKKISRFEDLMGFSIGYVRDSAYFDRFNHDKNLNKIAGNTEDQLIKMLLERRFDVIVGTDCQMDYDLTQRNLTQQIVLTDYRPPHKTDLYIGFSKNSKLFKRLDEFNLVLKDMLADGTIDGIIAKYVGNGSQQDLNSATER